MPVTPDVIDQNPPDPEGKAPEFDGEFDAEKAKRLVANLRADVASLKTERDGLKSDRDAFKAAAEKTGDDRDKALADAVKRADDAERTLAISKHNLPEDILSEFADYLTGTPDEVSAKAAKLAARFVKEEQTPPADPPDGDEETPPVSTPSGRPRPALVPGHGGETPAAFDPVAIAKAARRS